MMSALLKWIVDILVGAAWSGNAMTSTPPLNAPLFASVSNTKGFSASIGSSKAGTGIPLGIR